MTSLSIILLMIFNSFFFKPDAQFLTMAWGYYHDNNYRIVYLYYIERNVQIHGIYLQGALSDVGWWTAVVEVDLFLEIVYNYFIEHTKRCINNPATSLTFAGKFICTFLVRLWGYPHSPHFNKISRVAPFQC